MKKLKNIFSFHGTASRLEFWLVHLLWFPLLYTLKPLIIITEKLISGSGEVILTIFGLACCWASLATEVRRWRDRDKSWAWIFIKCIPVIGTLWAFIELGLFPQKIPENQRVDFTGTTPVD